MCDQNNDSMMDSNLSLSEKYDPVVDSSLSLGSKYDPIIDSHQQNDEKNTLKKTPQMNCLSADGESSQEKLMFERRTNVTKDCYCWQCHKNEIDFHCKVCPRSLHIKCLPNDKKMQIVRDSLCPECADILNAEDGNNPCGCMSLLNGNIQELSQLLRFTMLTIKSADHNHTFFKPVSATAFPDYRTFIVNPMDLGTIEKNVNKNMYASTQSFLADVKWIYHNSVVYNESGHAFCKESLNIIRVAKSECSEIEICPDCYKNYYEMDDKTYFAEPCRKPHSIVWAKLAGHPYWPAKVVKFNETNDKVDVRFFGTHDKAWLPLKNCFLMSRDYPRTTKPSKFDEGKFNAAIRDMNRHLDRLDQVHPGLFKFAEPKTYLTHDDLYLSNREESVKNTKKSLNINNYDVPLRNLKIMPSSFDLNQLSKDQIEFDLPPVKKFRRSISSSSSLSSKTNNSASCGKLSTHSSVALSHEDNKSKSDEKMDKENGGKDLNDNEFKESFIENSNDESMIDKKLIDDPLNCNESVDDLKIKSAFRQSIDSLSSESAIKLKIEENSLIEEDKSQISNKCISLKTVTVMGKSDSNIIIPDGKKSSNEKIINEEENIDSSCMNVSDLIKNNKMVQVSNLKEELEEKQALIEKLKRLINQLKDEKNDINKKYLEAEKKISEVKRKQWCINCQNEAILPCCWNTAYCTVQCQHAHWPTHMKTCRRKQRNAQQQTSKS